MPKGDGATPAEKEDKPADTEAGEDQPESTGIKKPGAKKESDDGKTDKPENNESDEGTEGDEPSDDKDGKTGEAADDEPGIAPEVRTKIEGELDKPEGAEDLTGFSPREKGVFWELRKERLKRQRAEQETDELRFEKLKTELKKEVAPEAEPDEEADPFAGKEDDDLLTVAEVKAALKKLKAPAEKPKGPAPKPLMSPDEIRVHKVEANTLLERKGIKDFYDVIDYAETAFGQDPDIAHYLRVVKAKGNNVALAAYHMIKGSAKWPAIEAAIAKSKGGKIPDGNKERAKKIEDNTKKIRTTGGGGNAPAPSDEYTFAEIEAMTPRDFGRLPKKTRDAILEKFGSNPNVG